MEQGLQQFIGSPIDIIYLEQDDRTTQRKIDILTAGDQCVFAYCFNRREPELLRNRDILAVLPVDRCSH
ncbi:hypothetical protein [Gorillibacterium sp. sgz500922]|uniref:hypothetical protein n=1 Tax=Gorillibacterium sp. sgz500922 TaxID=3446694 RepID=UPI003F661FBE